MARKSLFRKLMIVAATVVAALVMCPDISAQKKPKGYTDPYKGYSEEIFMDMDFEPNLATPLVPLKVKEAVAKRVRATAESLRRKATVDLMRDDEVIVVTIPTDHLFMPNDTLLSADAEGALAPLPEVMKDPMMYKVVLAMHTDDTGSELYRDELSSARLNSVYDWFMTRMDNGQLSEQLIIIPFSMAGFMPLVDNDTRAHRSENRRLEVYLVPGPKLIDLAWSEVK